MKSLKIGLAVVALALVIGGMALAKRPNPYVYITNPAQNGIYYVDEPSGLWPAIEGEMDPDGTWLNMGYPQLDVSVWGWSAESGEYDVEVASPGVIYTDMSYLFTTGFSNQDRYNFYGSYFYGGTYGQDGQAYLRVKVTYVYLAPPTIYLTDTYDFELWPGTRP